jgi:hypothetical protein
VHSTGADALWQRVEQMFAEDDRVGTALTGAVLAPAMGQHVDSEQFAAGVVDHRPGHAAPFDGSVFTDAAMTAGRCAVAIDTATIARPGLGFRATVVQASDGLAPYDFTLFEVPLATASGFETEKTAVITHSEHRDAPPGGDLVF